MGYLGRTLRVAVALGLVLALGSVGELPHEHIDAGIHGEVRAEVEHSRLSPVVSADDFFCPVCVLQRLLSQSESSGPAALEKPSASGTIAGVLESPVADYLSVTSSPRGPPPGA